MGRKFKVNTFTPAEKILAGLIILGVAILVIAFSFAVPALVAWALVSIFTQLPFWPVFWLAYAGSWILGAFVNAIRTRS